MEKNKKKCHQITMVFGFVILMMHCQWVQATWFGQGRVAQKIGPRMTTQNLQQFPRSIDVDGMQRSYQIYLPATTQQALPVVIALHGAVVMQLK